MRLTVLQVQKAKPKEKPYKLTDGQGLYLLVEPSGRKYWRMKYYFARRERLMSLGVFPDVSLADARYKRDEVRRQKLNNIDPAEYRREKQREFIATHENTFEKVAREWHETKKSRWSEYYARQVIQRLEADVFPRIGNRLTNKIVPSDVLKVARAIEERDAIEMAHRAVSMCGQIFQFAIITDRATTNPAAALRGALKTAPRNHRAHLDVTELPGFIQKLESYDRSLQTKTAIQLLILTFVRPSELCGARWSEIDFERKEWRIPAERMKMRTPHIVPLSTQALEKFAMMKKLTGYREHVFPSKPSPRNHITSNSMLYVIYELGFKGKVVSHGFRGTASTILNESGLFDKDVIERQLAHMERNRVRASYNHADYLPKRREMMQWWADHISRDASAKITEYSLELDMAS